MSKGDAVLDAFGKTQQQSTLLGQHSAALLAALHISRT
jgi:hypothetical protein